MARLAEALGVIMCVLPVGAAAVPAAGEFGLIPYPQEVTRLDGVLGLGPARYEIPSPSAVTAVATASLSSYLPRSGRAVTVRLGSVEEGYGRAWLDADQVGFLERPATSPEASLVRITQEGITVVGKGRWGMLYGVQTVNQLVRGTDAQLGVWQMRRDLPCLEIRDWPDLRWRCLSPTMTWYSGYNRLEGYDLCNWTLDEWKWLVDWSLLHKFNAWALCLYGNWPFTLAGYPETTLDVDSFRYDPKTGRKTPWRFTHKNIQAEFLPELVRYANARGVKLHAYIGKNSFNGTYGLKHPDANAGGAAELIPFHPGVGEYWDAVVRRLLEIGFDGVVFEDPEANHVPNQNDLCYKTFWEPWAARYGFASRAETDPNNPPLGVHVEYYSWLFRTFDDLLRKHATALGRPEPEVYLISHILLSRVVGESTTQAERDGWFAYIDEKQGRKVPVVILEADEAKYVSFLGHDRVASLGGRGGSCTNAMRRIASINNLWVAGSMGADLAYERACQKRIYEAGGFGAMAYVFEWTNTEVFGYLGAQYLWRAAGVPGLDNDSQTDFLRYAYRSYYGDQVGELVARVMDESSCVNDAMMLDGVYGSQYPTTGAPLQRDFQLLAALADRSVEMACQAYVSYTGKEPDPVTPAYRQKSFRWNGFNPRDDKRFKSERLRCLYVSARRSQAMCRAVLAHRMSQRLIAQGAPAGGVLRYLDTAVGAARENQRLYCLNYDDDYDWTDGLCSRVVAELESIRGQFLAAVSTNVNVVQAWTFDRPGDVQGWTEGHDIETPVVRDGALVTRAVGRDPILVQAALLSAAVSERCVVEIDIAADCEGRARLFWATAEDLARLAPGAYPFAEERVRNTTLRGDGKPHVYRLSPGWKGSLARLRLDIPPEARVSLHSLRIVELPEAGTLSAAELRQALPDTVRRSAERPLCIAWETQADLVPADPVATHPGLYLSTDIGLDRRPDLFRLGVVFTVEAREGGGAWRTLFRRALLRRTTSWEHWEVPLAGLSGSVTLRFTTDSYSRAQDRTAPNWTWAVWGQPQVVEVGGDGSRRVAYEFSQQLDSARMLVRLDQDGLARPFDGRGRDSTGATFALAPPDGMPWLSAAEAADWQSVEGFAEWAAEPAHRSEYRHYLGSVVSGWTYSHEGRELTWRTAVAPERKTTALAFIGGTGYGVGKAELWCDGERLLSFDTARPADGTWRENGAELRFVFGGDTRSPTIPYGISGIYVLVLPAARVTPGRALTLAVKVQPGGSDWFMVHEYRSVRDAIRAVLPPLPEKPAIGAFTPHLDGRFGVTLAEFDIRL